MTERPNNFVEAARMVQGSERIQDQIFRRRSSPMGRLVVLGLLGFTLAVVLYKRWTGAA